MSGNLTFKLKLIFVPSEENNWRPKFLEGDFIFYYLLFLLILKLITFSFLFYFPKTIFFADITKTTLFNLTNQTRIISGLPPLKENPKLTQAAYLKAKDMLEKDYFSHFSPEGLSPWYWFKLAGYDYSVAGENLAIGFLDTKEVYQAWLESPSHKTNLLNEKYQEVGIFPLKGEFQGNEVTVVVQLFGSQKVEPIQKEKPGSSAKEKVKEEVLPLSSLGAEEIVLEEQPKEILSQTEKSVFAPAGEEFLTGISFNFFSFFNSYYYQILQVIIYASLLFIIGVLIINIFVRIDIQHKDLIFKTLGVIGVLILFAFLDREIILNLIPHNFLIG